MLGLKLATSLGGVQQGGVPSSSFARFNGDSARLMRVAAGAAQPGGTELRMGFTFKQTAADIAVSGAKYISRFGTGAAGGNRLRGSCYLSGASLIFRLGEDYSGVDGANVTFYGISSADIDATCVIIYDGAAPLAKSTPGVPGNPALYRNGVLVTAGATVVARVGSGNWSVSDRVSIGGKAFTGTNPFIGQLRDVYIGIDDDPGLSNDDFVEKFYKDGSAVALGNGVSVTGNQPFLCMSGDANDWNFANVSSSETDWYMRGKGVDYAPEVNKIAWRKPYVIAEAELGVTVAGDGSLEIDDVDAVDPTLPKIFSNGVRFGNSYDVAGGAVEYMQFEGLGITDDLIDDDLPIHVLLWNNYGHQRANSFITMKVWHDYSGAPTEFTTFSYTAQTAAKFGWYTLPIIPAFAGLAIADGDGYLPAGCTVTPEATAWTGVKIDRIDVGFNDFLWMRKPSAEGRDAVGTCFGLVRGYGHTPTVLFTADDGNATIEAEEDAALENICQILGNLDSGGLYPNGIPLTISLIDAGVGGFRLSDAQLDTIEGQADVSYTGHGSYAITNSVLAFPCTITTPFVYGETVTQSPGAGSGTFLGVIPGGMLIGIAASHGDTAFDDPAGSATLSGSGSGAGSHVNGQVPGSPTAEELVVDLIYHRDKILSSRGVLPKHHVAPEGALRNGTQAQNSVVNNALALAGFNSSRTTVGGLPTAIPFNLDSWGDGFAERYGIGGVSLESTAEHLLTQDILDYRIDVTLKELGGCMYAFFHTPAPTGTARGGGAQPNLVIEELTVVAAGLDALREAGGLKLMSVDDYSAQYDTRVPRGWTDPLDDT